MAKKPIDLQVRFREALNYLLQQTQKPEGWYGKPYFSASCLERVVRENTQKEVTGYRSVRFTGLGIVTLLEHCRNYLSRCVRNGELRGDQPSGKHTCTGLRFRSANQELTDAENKTQAIPREERHRRIRHFDVYCPSSDSGPFRPMKPLCQKNKIKRRRYAARPKNTYLTDHPEEVTCKNCLKMMTKLPHPLVPELTMTTPIGIVADYLEERGDSEAAQVLRAQLYQPS
jgi:hypothetical protein